MADLSTLPHGDQTAAGWYPDPDDPEWKIRYWDGRGWTDRVSFAGADTDPRPADALARRSREWLWLPPVAAVLGLILLIRYRDLRGLLPVGLLVVLAAFVVALGGCGGDPKPLGDRANDAIQQQLCDQQAEQDDPGCQDDD